MPKYAAACSRFRWEYQERQEMKRERERERERESGAKRRQREGEQVHCKLSGQEGRRVHARVQECAYLSHVRDGHRWVKAATYTSAVVGAEQELQRRALAVWDGRRHAFDDARHCK